MNNKSIEQWANEYMLDKNQADTAHWPVTALNHNAFIAGAEKQKEILSQELEDLRLDFKRVDNLCSNMNEREKLLMDVIQKCKESLELIENKASWCDCMDTSSIVKIGLASIEQTLKQINGGV